MAIAGGFAALGGACDILGWEYHMGPGDIQVSQIGFIGLAAALLGRNSAFGIGVASLLFGALINGTSGRQLDQTIFPPELAGNLTTIIQGLVVLFVGLNLGGLLVFARRRRRAA
jgi:simple sugar transport system permease protein